MPDQNALIELLLLDELFHVLGHDGVVVFLRVERVAMIPEVLSFARVSGVYQSTGRPTYNSEDLTFQISGQRSMAVRQIQR